MNEDDRATTLAIPEATRRVLQASRFAVLSEEFAWVRAGRVEDPERHLIVIRDAGETTVVTRPENLDRVEVLERNPERWRLVTIHCASPFYCVGFTAQICAALTAEGVDLLFVATYSRDWIFVREADVGKATSALRAVGMQEA